MFLRFQDFPTPKKQSSYLNAEAPRLIGFAPRRTLSDQRRGRKFANVNMNPRRYGGFGRQTW